MLIPNGVNRHRKLEAEQIDRLFGLKKDEYILFLGRIVPEKGATVSDRGIQYSPYGEETGHCRWKLGFSGIYEGDAAARRR